MSTNPAIAGIPLVLGGNVFGFTADEDASFAVLDAFHAAGGRMIDTADVYSAWVPGHKGGESETVLGKWFAQGGKRADMRLHTKTGMLGGQELYEPARVVASLAASLDRLQTDYVDLYYAHRDYEELPIGDIVAAFDRAVRTGQVRALGASNFTAARLGAALQAASDQGATPFSVLQNEYNLVSREAYGADLQALCTTRGIPMLPFFGLASGFLTGKYRTEADLGKSVRGQRMGKLIESGKPMLAAMDDIVRETGATHAQVALAWLRMQPGIGAPIASATSVEQVRDLCEAATLELSADQLARLTAAL
ncbi:aryl-alcohol dehydrogenase-like predicted oxidoreductase [Novosphingobium kunmingense]|uniref:Aryl-alcohol dehydrogenase-like predicted oxidoreductase n=1 Tax=Novosphingobium kunmingense TaxID=1211806 RepID=A0A2N0I262_9SPHN|nr:aldo/keto reductase [Novosphingobium kunmingense]PKB25262.1 aryl-alcohol dehydrogenase-like predicted oxidoreductase [Novosphingobium kunmingense]